MPDRKAKNPSSAIGNPRNREGLGARASECLALCDAGTGVNGAVATCAFDMHISGTVPDWVELMPAGAFTPRDSRAAWRNDDPDAVVAASRALNMDLPVDYEHQTDLAPENGQPAPAAGWITELQVRAGAIWGRVEWTGKARAMLAAREYRFLSPTFYHDKKSRVVTRIARAALTNNPALELKALTKQEMSDMDPKLKKVLELLGLAETADEAALAAALADLQGSARALATLAGAAGVADGASAEEIATAVSELVENDSADSVRAIARAAGLADTASPADIEKAVASAVAKAAAGSPDPSEFVPRSEFDQVKATLSSLQKDGAESKATAAVDAAIEDGKVTPGNRDWALAYATKDPEGFDEFVGNAPAIVAPGSKGNAQPPKAGSALSAEELETCRLTGTDPETFKKQRDALATEEIA